MNALIQISHRVIGQTPVQTVNARELHAFLEIKKDFSSWMKVQIERARLIEDRDFTKLTQKGEFACIGQTRIDYFLTMESAKHISMLSGTEKGFEVREYFIDCERQAKEAIHSDPIQILNDPVAMRGLLLNYSEKVIALESKLDAQTPKVEALDRIATANGAMCVTNAAKTLQMRPKELFGWLQANRWIYRRPGSAGWLAYQDKLQSQVLQHKIITVSRSNGDETVKEQVLITSKGLTRLAEHFSLH